MALPFTETWTGTNGDAWGGNWTTGGTGTVDIQSNAGRMLLSTGGSYTDYNRALLADQSAADTDLRLTVGPLPNGGESYTSIFVRTDRTWAGNDNPSNGYRLFFATGGSQFYHVDRWDSGSSTNLTGDVGITTNNTTFNVRIWGRGTALKFKYWTGATEPAAWNHETTDSNHTTRTGMQLAFHGGAAGAANSISWDNLAIAGAPPIFKAAGAEDGSATGITLAWPTHAVDDVALMLIETCGGEAVNVTNLQGFTALPDSPSSTGTTTNGTRITAYWHRATSTSMSSPTFGDAGNHCYGVILTFLGCITSGNPYDDTAADVKAAASTSMTMPGLTTTVDNTTVVNIASRDNDSAAAAGSNPANADLRNILEIWDSGTALQNGGGIMAWQGHDDTAGTVTTTTATVTSSINAYLTVNLKPPPPATSASAGVATATGAGNNSTVTVGFTAGVAAATGAGLDATISTAGPATNADAGVASATAAANSSTLSLATSGGTAPSTGTANGSTGAITVTPVGDPILDENGDPLTDENGNVLRTESAPTAVGQAHNATASVGTAINVNAEAATATGAANNAAPAIGAAAGSGSGTGSGNTSSGSLQITAAVAAAAAAANNATVSTAAGATANAETATATSAANSPTLTIHTNSGTGSSTGTGNTSSGTLHVNAGTADATAAANPASISGATNVTPATATAAGAANTPTPSIGTSAGTGGATGTGNSSTGALAVTPITAAADGLANNANAGSHQTAVSGVAAATAAGINPTPAVNTTPTTGVATGSGTAATTTSYNDHLIDDLITALIDTDIEAAVVSHRIEVTLA